MALKLAIENVATLPDGGPVSIAVSGHRGIDIGRDAHLDWTLPDPNRFISGKHCEIRYDGGSYILTDVSSNGTFLNGSPHRMAEPRRLQTGDRILIGQYIVSVVVDSTPQAPAEPFAPRRAPADLWDSAEEAPAPIDPRQLRPQPERAKQADFLDWAMDVFDPLGPAPAAARPARSFNEDAAWLPPQAPAPAPAAPPPAPAPRRPLWIDEEETPPTHGLAAPVFAGAEEGAAAAPLSPKPPLPLVEPDPPRPLAEPIALAPESSAPSSARGSEDPGARFVRRFAEAAGLPPEALARKDADELAAELGGLMKIVAEDVKQLLHARLEAKRLARSAHHTTIEAQGNNPLKFSPTAADALKIMFGPPMRSYLGPAATLAQSFDDLKRHQIDTLAAMQGAVKMLVEDLDPAEIEKSVEPEGALSALFSSRKGKLWDAYAARWRAKTHRCEDGLIGAFMLYFPQCYDRNGKS